MPPEQSDFSLRVTVEDPERDDKRLYIDIPYEIILLLLVGPTWFIVEYLIPGVSGEYLRYAMYALIIVTLIGVASNRRRTEVISVVGPGPRND